MCTERKNELRNVMSLAWQFIRRNGYSMSEALRVAWRNIKLRSRLMSGIVRFYFMKVDGTVREAFGTLKSGIVPATGGHRRNEATCQVFFDTEKGEWRCYKKANLLNIAGA